MREVRGSSAGAGPRAADLAGISTRRVWTGVYASSAVLAGLAGVLLAGFSTGGDTNIGNNYLFPGLAAVIVGGTMMGGRGDYLRTCLGALIITHYQRILHYIKPRFVHIMLDGRIVLEGGVELVERLEREGYDQIRQEFGAETAAAGAARSGDGA